MRCPHCRPNGTGGRSRWTHHSASARLLFLFDRVQDRKEFIHKNLQAINETPGLGGRQAQKIRKLVAESLVTPPETPGTPALLQLVQDLTNNVPAIKSSVAIAAREHYGREIAPNDFELRVERIAEEDWHVETNLGAQVGLDAEATHKAVEHGLLGVGGLDLRIEYMKTYNAMTGLKIGELPVLEEKLELLARQLDPDVHKERFERVIEVLGLPDIDPRVDVQDVDMGRLVEILDDDEAKEFRRWLRGIDTLDDAEIENEIHRIRDLVSRAVRSGPGKGVRFLVTTGIGALNPFAGAGADLLDSFLVERIVPEPGPTAFLGQLYPSIFKDPE